MNAGLPGLGIGGMFFILLALLAPIFELGRVLRGTSTPQRRRQVGRQFALAVAMIAAVDLSIRAAVLSASALGLGDGGVPSGVTGLALAPVGATFALLLLIVGVAKGADLAFHWRRRSRSRRAARHRLESRRPLLYSARADDLSDADLGGTALEFEGRAT